MKIQSFSEHQQNFESMSPQLPVCPKLLLEILRSSPKRVDCLFQVHQPVNMKQCLHHVESSDRTMGSTYFFGTYTVTTIQNNQLP